MSVIVVFLRPLGLRLFDALSNVGYEGEALIATYDRRTLEVLIPFHKVVNPLTFELIKTYGHLESPEQALSRYFGDHKLKERAVGANLQ